MYSWQLDYIAAILETDNRKAHHKFYEAVAAIEQRLLSPIEPGSLEDQALKQAQKVLAVLRAQAGEVKPTCPLHNLKMRKAQGQNVMVCPKPAVSNATRKKTATSRLPLLRQSVE